MLGACGDGGQSSPSACLTAGCALNGAALLDVFAVNDPHEIFNTTITACLDNACSAGPMPTPPYTYVQNLSGDILAGVELEPGPTGTGLIVRASVYFDNAATHVEAMNGDIYSVSVLASDGQPVGTGTWIAEYSDPYFPNGIPCGPRCRNVTLSRVGGSSSLP